MNFGAGSGVSRLVIPAERCCSDLGEKTIASGHRPALCSLLLCSLLHLQTYLVPMWWDSRPPSLDRLSSRPQILQPVGPQKETSVKYASSLINV